MKYALFAALAALAAVSMAAEQAPRNPFWNQGYEGVRRPISAEPRFRVEHETPADKVSVTETRTADDLERRARLTPAEREAEDLDNQLWSRASRRLTFGATMFLSEGSNSAVRASIVINGRVYGLGDLVSLDCESTRFTWQIESISTDGRLKLKRLIHRTNRKRP